MKNFQGIREEFKHWVDEEDSAGRRSVGAREVQAEGWEEEAICGGVTMAAAGNYSNNSCRPGSWAKGSF